MKNAKSTIRIAVPVARVFDYLTHPENFLEIWPSMVEISKVQQKGDGGHAFDWQYKMAGMHLRGHSDTTKVEKNRYIETHNTGGIPSIFRWTFQGRDDTTDVTCDAEYEIPIPLLGRLGEAYLVKMNQRENEVVLANLKERLELGIAHATGTRPSQPTAHH
jgi:uncharacterized protein YndB with AHSA1/START domain